MNSLWNHAYEISNIVIEVEETEDDARVAELEKELIDIAKAMVMSEKKKEPPKKEFNDQTEVAVILISKESLLDKFKKESGEYTIASKEKKAEYKRQYEQGIAFIENMSYEDLETFAVDLSSPISSAVRYYVREMVKDRIGVPSDI